MLPNNLLSDVSMTYLPVVPSILIAYKIVISPKKIKQNKFNSWSRPLFPTMLFNKGLFHYNYLKGIIFYPYTSPKCFFNIYQWFSTFFIKCYTDKVLKLTRIFFTIDKAHHAAGSWLKFPNCPTNKWLPQRLVAHLWTMRSTPVCHGTVVLCTIHWNLPCTKLLEGDTRVSHRQMFL